VLLRSCETGRGARGAAFLAALAQASGASVAAATGAGAAALGGGWALDGAPALRAPLTALGIAAYTGVMVAINWLGPKGSKGKPTSGTWNTTTNWDAGKVPGSSDDVNLGGNSAYTVTLDTTGNVKSLTIANNDATLAIGTQTLNIDIANTTSSSINVTNGHVTIAGGKIVGSGGLALASGTDLNGSGNLSTTFVRRRNSDGDRRRHARTGKHRHQYRRAAGQQRQQAQNSTPQAAPRPPSSWPRLRARPRSWRSSPP
jgi:hypothetical protein